MKQRQIYTERNDAMYKIYSFGYGTRECTEKYVGYEDAKAKFDQLVSAYCDGKGIDLCDDEVSYDDFPGEFIFGIDQYGVDIYRVVEVPEFENVIDKKLWEVTAMLMKAEDAILDYKYSLQDCCAEDYISYASSNVNAVRMLLKHDKERWLHEL